MYPQLPLVLFGPENVNMAARHVDFVVVTGQVLEVGSVLEAVMLAGGPAMESFFHSLKVEHVNDCRYRTREETKADVFEYIETKKSPGYIANAGPAKSLFRRLKSISSPKLKPSPTLCPRSLVSPMPGSLVIFYQ